MYSKTSQQDLVKYQLHDVCLTHPKGRAYELQDDALPKPPQSLCGGAGQRQGLHLVHVIKIKLESANNL